MAESTNKINKLTIVVGAGDDFSCNLTEPAQNYLLIDARREAADALQQSHAGDTRVDVQQTVITPVTGRTQFYHYSLPEFSSTLKPEALKQLLPGLSLKGSEYVSGVSLSDIIAEELPAEHLELILNVPGQELALLRSLETTNNLLALDALMVTSATDMLYEEGNTATQLNDWLSQLGFKQQQETEQAFGLVTQHWSIDKQAIHIETIERELDECKEQLAQETKRANSAQSKINELVDSLNQAEQAQDEAVARAFNVSEELAQANEENQKHIDWAHNLEAELEQANKIEEQLIEERDEALARAIEAEKQRDEAVARASGTSKELVKVTVQRDKTNEHAQKLEEELKQSKIENEALRQKLEAAERFNEQLAKLNERMDYMFEQQRLQLEQATNALGRHITQTSSQQVTELKARLSLERMFGTNLINLNENDSNLSEVTAVTLTQQLKENSYDLIIEFGAGKSTEFLANAIINNHSPNRRIENNSSVSDFDASDFDLPQHILSFEHDKKQFDSIKKRIVNQNLQNIVDLRYSPLVPAGSQDELFYDCKRSLSDVARLMTGRDPKVLVVITSNTKELKNSALTLPVILQSLSAMRLDLVMDNDLVTQQMDSHWTQLLEDRALPIERIKGRYVYSLRINP